MADIQALLKLYKDMKLTSNPSPSDFSLARAELQRAISEELKTPQSEQSEKEVLSNQIKMLLSGELFPPNKYTDNRGDAQVWDDRIFFDKMLKWNGHWTAGQVNVIKRRLKLYAEKGCELQKDEPKRRNPIAPDLHSDIPF